MSYQFRLTEDEKDANFKVDSKLLFYLSPVSEKSGSVHANNLDWLVFIASKQIDVP